MGEGEIRERVIGEGEKGEEEKGESLGALSKGPNGEIAEILETSGTARETSGRGNEVLLIGTSLTVLVCGVSVTGKDTGISGDKVSSDILSDTCTNPPSAKSSFSSIFPIFITTDITSLSVGGGVIVTFSNGADSGLLNSFSGVAFSGL